jgi:hypothetical protein
MRVFVAAGIVRFSHDRGDAPRFHRLCADDEAISLRNFRQIFEDEEGIHAAENAAEAAGSWGTRGHTSEQITDQRMPGESGGCLSAPDGSTQTSCEFW